ncbi:MAG: S8 family peptidase [Flavobacteriales bacterium]
MNKIISLFALVALSISMGFAQPKEAINWYLKSPKKDKVYGTAANEAYEILTGKKSIPVIVAVIDSGVETDHEDLKDVIWVNEDEIPGNGKDDDHNGYIDDVNGWSFLGGATQDIKDEATELKRLVFLDRTYFGNKRADEIPAADKARFETYQIQKKKYDEEVAKNAATYQNIKMLADYMQHVKDASNGVFSKETNASYVAQNEVEKKIQSRIKLFFISMSPEQLDHEISGALSMFESQVKMAAIDADSVRNSIVGDDPNDLSQRIYGCNRYEGPDAMHGTHVSGIIAGTRGNGIGIDGVANNAKIMVLRAVPNGDERDKDVANAIRYAVDNGAKVINMSFGKYYVLHKAYVDEAVQYALDHDVLLVHAAGNDAKDKDIEDSYPTRKSNSGITFPNWIDVGASSASRKPKQILADFSNYGATTVDFFAPGVDIYSTVPDGKYEDASGTSMACPATAGVAALIRSYFPTLTAVQVKEVLMKTTTPYKKKARIPGSKEKKKLNQLCITGGFVNAANAVNYILNMTGSRN